MYERCHNCAFSGPNWQEIDASQAHNFAGKVKASHKIGDMDLFGPTIQFEALKLS